MTGIVLIAAVCSAQDVHIAVGPKPDAPEKPAQQLHGKPFISNVDVVLVPVTVVDTATRIITGLERSNFVLLEDGKPQAIEYFYTQDAPVSVGIIFDQSGSMGQAVNQSR